MTASHVGVDPDMNEVVRRALLTVAPDVEVEPDEAQAVEQDDDADAPVPLDADAVARSIRGLPPLKESAAYTKAHAVARAIRDLG